MRWIWCVTWVLLGCDPKSEEAARGAASAAAERAASAAATAAEQAASAASTVAGHAASAVASAAGDATRRLNAELATLGEGAAARVDAELKAWLEGVSGDDLLDRITKGASSATGLAKTAAPLAKAVETDATVLPIVRPVGGSTADIDEAIGDMPRTEVIDGVTVGFRQLTLVDNDQHLSEKGYLVLWRRGDYLLGFVYRSKREVKLDVLVAETPKLMKAVSRATP